MPSGRRGAELERVKLFKCTTVLEGADDHDDHMAFVQVGILDRGLGIHGYKNSQIPSGLLRCFYMLRFDI